MTAVLQKITVFMEMIKFSHTLFALPFALSGALLAVRGLPSGRQLLLIILAMVGARTAAMALNRLIDAEIDARNPRTAGRAIPAGLLSKGAVLLAIALSVALLLWSAAMLNPLCLKLSPIALFFLVLYSYCKRFTALAHVVLGICLAAAPIGAWAALRGTIELPAIVLGLLVLFWVAGFDILYALQDLEYDRSAGLHSIPVALGVEGSLWLARLFHLATVGLLLWLIVLLELGGWFWIGSWLMTAMLLYEHWLLRRGDLTKLDAAFFTMNGYISLTFLAATAADVFWGGGNL
ncbi:MAG: 4-hydroxybenzoate octaprenyltransferase [Trichlorobacter sp.]|jgi:4-hydroxybenzoate polyprenyltransferase